MLDIVLGLDDQVSKWVALRIDGLPNFGKCRTIGIHQDGRMLAGIVFHNYDGNSIEISMAADDPRWCTRQIVRDVLGWPFKQLGVRRMQVTILKRNKKARKFVERLGFVYEGTGRKAAPGGLDMCVYSMLKTEAERWTGPLVTEVKDGEKRDQRLEHTIH